MKKYFFSADSFTLIVIGLFLLFSSYSYSQTTKIIDPSGTEDYQTFTAAIADITEPVTGPIVFKVNNGTYNEQVIIPAISGVSDVNTITFESTTGNISDVILTNSSGAPGNNYTLKFDGADHVTFTGMTIKATGSTYARVIEITNGSTNNTFTDCQIEGVSETDELVFSDPGNDLNFSNTFKGNVFLNGSSGIYLRGSALADGLVVKKNEFNNQSENGIYIHDYENAVIDSNYIHSSYAIKGIWIDESNPKKTTLTKNRIVLSGGGTGIYISPQSDTYSGEGSAGVCDINNNFISLTTTSAGNGIALNASTIIANVLHNTIHISGNNSSSNAFLHNWGGSSSIDCRNNIFANYAYGRAIDGDLVGYDYNLVYSNGPLLCIGAADLYEWQRNYSQGENSISVDPYFTSETSFEVGNPRIQGSGVSLPAVTLDIEGQARDASNPDLGADEFTPSPVPLFGTYTIGGSGSPDYSTIYDAVKSVVINGISNDVVFNLASGTYDEQVTIQEISGTSESHSVTFQSASGDTSDVTIQYTPAYQPHNHVLKLLGADYLVFKDLSITSDTEWCWPVSLVEEATHNRFESNHIYLQGNVSYDFDHALVHSSSNDSSNYFIANHFENNVHGISIDGIAEGIDDIQIKNNIFSGMQNFGIYIINSRNLEISGNRMSGTTSQMHGSLIYLRNSNGMIFNNFVSAETGFQSYGIYLSNADMKVYHNSVRLTGSGSNANYAFYTGGPDIAEVKNNIFINQATGRAMYCDTTGLISDYNILYTNGSLLTSSINNLNSADLEEWQTESDGRDQHSISRLPEFVSETDLHTADPWISNLGTPIAEVTVDIDGESRDTESPDIGADEFEAGDIFAGTYTIGPTGDFTSFTKAVDSISQVGAIDTVIFLVQDGTYSEQFTIKEIPYVTDSIPVIFRPENEGDEVVLEFTNTETENYLIRLDSADHLTFRNFTFRALNPDNARIIQIENGATYNQFIGNSFESQGTAHAIIFSQGDQDHGNKFDSNSFTGGKIGIQMIGTNESDPEAGIQILNNEFFDQYAAGIYLKYLDTPRVVNNRILHENMIEGQYEGIAMLNCQGSNMRYGLIANNVIAFQADQLSGGIVFDATSRQKIYHNSVYITGSNTETRCLNQQNGGGSNYANNNIFMNESGGIVIYMPNTSSIWCDYNDLFTNGDNLAYTDQYIETLSNWQSSYGQDANSLSIDPDFVSSTDLHTYHPLLNGAGTPLAEVTLDLEGTSRDNTNPDIGAYEYTDAIYDLGEDMLICKGEQLILDAGDGFESYEWNTGSATQTLTIDTTGVDSIYYKVTVSYNSNFYTDSLLARFSGPEIDLGDEDGFCEGGSVVLDAGSGYTSYLWSDGSTEPTLNVSSSGEFYVEVTDSLGCTVTDTVDVVESTGPVVDLGTELELCDGDSVVLDAGEGNYSYTWSDGTTDQYLTVLDSGRYYVSVVDMYSCESSDTVKVNLLTSPDVNFSDTIGYCSGESVILDAGGGNNAYLWSDGSTDQLLTVSQEGEYYVSAINESGCTASDTVYVSEYPNPSVSIFQSEGQLVVEGPGNNVFQWFKDEGADIIEMENATESTLSPLESGDYYVEASNEYGCSAVSNIINFSQTQTSLSDLMGREGVKVYPNPASETLLMNFDRYFEVIDIRILSISGKIFFERSLNHIYENYPLELDVSSIPAGHYVLQLQLTDKIIQGNLIIQ